MKKICCFFALCFALLPLAAFSAIPSYAIYIKIKNKTNFDAYVSMPPTYSWRCVDLCKEQFIPAHGSNRFYTDANFFFATLATLNIRYGATVTKAEMWINSDHNVDENVKTAIVRLMKSTVKDSTAVYADIIGVGSELDNIQTAIYPENMWKGDAGPVNIILSIN